MRIDCMEQTALAMFGVIFEMDDRFLMKCRRALGDSSNGIMLSVVLGRIDELGVIMVPLGD